MYFLICFLNLNGTENPGFLSYKSVKHWNINTNQHLLSCKSFRIRICSVSLVEINQTFFSSNSVDLRTFFFMFPGNHWNCVYDKTNKTEKFFFVNKIETLKRSLFCVFGERICEMNPTEMDDPSKGFIENTPFIFPPQLICEKKNETVRKCKLHVFINRKQQSKMPFWLTFWCSWYSDWTCLNRKLFYGKSWIEKKT